jgi:O-antigen/teichoic acid export membrane protein
MTDKKELKSKAIKGSIWSLIETFSVQIVQFVVGIVLARLLEPKDFGLIALTGIFTSISAAITDGGFEKTLIQKKDLLPIQISTVFYINVILGAFLTLLLIVLAPFISDFFNAPALTPILQVISLGILLTSLAQTQQTLILKDLHFKKISRVRINTSIIGGITGIVLAYRGFGVWALVYSSLVPQIFRVIFYWLRSSWYPQLKFSFPSVKTLIPYGLNILGSSIFFFMIQQFNVFIVGKFYTKSELGLFNRGNRFPDLIVGIIQSVVLKMTLPLFAKLQDQPVELLETVKKTNKAVAFISFPLLVLLLIKSEDITIFLFTEKWRGSIIFLQLFCVVKLLEPFISIHRELILAQGLSKLLLKLFIILSISEICLILFVVKYGIIYLVLATFLSRVGQYLTYTIINSKRLGNLWVKELKWYTPYIVITAIMAVVVLLSGYAISLSGIHISLFLRLSIQLTLGLLAYSISAWKFRIEEIELVKSVVNLISEKIKR